MEKLTLVPWSGGYDSTALLIDRLENDENVKTVYIDLDSEKSWCERNAIIAMMEHIQHTDHETISVTLKGDFGYGYLFQPPLWLLNLFLYSSKFIDDYDEIEIPIAYVRGDDATKYVSSLSRIWETYHTLTTLKRPSPYLTFPFVGMSKGHILRRIKKANPKLTDYIWTCEFPETYHEQGISGYRECGNCAPCKRNPIISK